MQAPSGTSRGVRSRQLKPPRLLVDPAKLEFDDRTIVVRHTKGGGYVCFGFGAAGDLLEAVDSDPLLDKAIAARGLAPSSQAKDPFLARLATAVALAKDYDPGEDRDADGRWTDEGTSGAAAASTASAIADNRSLYGNSNVFAALKEIARRVLTRAAEALPEEAFAPAAAFFGTLFLPTNGSVVSAGSLPDDPEFSYKYDHDTGRLTVTQQYADGTTETVFSGHHDTDGVFRDENGNAIGRYLGDSVALDADAIRGYEARRKSDVVAPPGAIAQTTATTRSDPKLCPDPSPDKPGRQDPRAIEYQMVVSIRVNGMPLEPGMAIKIIGPDGDSVYLDDCNHEDGTLIDAKGDKYGEAMRSGRAYPWFGMVGKMMDQARRQIAAANGRPIEWHFADEGVADYMRARFAENGLNIRTVYTPPPDWWREKLAQIAKGAWHEFRYLPAMLPRW